MANEILLMDGVIYEEWTPTSHDELAGMVSEHHREIFGQDSLYFEVRQKVKGGSIAAIPDAYALTFAPDIFWVIEVERSQPDPYGHIVNQLSRFINGLGDPQSQRELRDAIFNNMSQADRQRAEARAGSALHPWLEKLIGQPSLIVITEKATDEIRRAVATLRVTPRVYEFRTFCRQGVGRVVHQHMFEPLVAGAPSVAIAPIAGPVPPPQPPTQKKKRYVGVHLLDLIQVGLLIPGQKIIWGTHKGVKYEADVLSSGEIKLADGAVFKTPSGASAYLTKASIDGWKWWLTVFDEKEGPLDELRKAYGKIFGGPSQSL